MTDQNYTVTQALTKSWQAFIEQYKQQHGHLPIIEQDDEWESPCIVGKHTEQGFDCWQPVKAEIDLSFDNVESALELTLHSDIKAYFTHGFSEGVDATHPHGNLQLLFAWSEQDFARLQQNLIGHVLMKKRLKQPITLFFAVTDEEDFILTLDNETGSIWVEQVGKKPHKKLADSMAEFLSQLTFSAD